MPGKVNWQGLVNAVVSSVGIGGGVFVASMQQNQEAGWEAAAMPAAIAFFGSLVQHMRQKPALKR